MVCGNKRRLLLAFPPPEANVAQSGAEQRQRRCFAPPFFAIATFADDRFVRRRRHARRDTAFTGTRGASKCRETQDTEHPYELFPAASVARALTTAANLERVAAFYGGVKGGRPSGPADRDRDGSSIASKLRHERQEPCVEAANGV
jgi:hypothetical protein